MTKSTRDMEEIAGWLAATEIERLELRSPGTPTLRFGRRGNAVVRLQEGEAPQPMPAEGTTAPVGVAAASVGVFLHGHPLGGRALVRVGERVDAGQPLGLLRVGVLLLPVASPCAGLVVAHAVAEGETVGYGTRLVSLHPL